MQDSLATTIAVMTVYLLGNRLAMRCLTGTIREIVLFFLNLAGVLVIICPNPETGSWGRMVLVAFLLVMLVQYAVLCGFVGSRSRSFWLSFFCPIIILILLRYVPEPVLNRLLAVVHKNRLPSMIGLSYLAFRCSRLALEVRNGSVRRPTFWQYVNFALFLPTMSVGPINTYSNYRRGFDSPYEVPLTRTLLRIGVGFAKYQFLGGILGRLGYDEFLRNGHPHHWVDLPIAMVFYYLYLYCNFSGFCDMAIGASAFIGIPVAENFDNPFAARNIKDFWNRWHITLSVWMRDVVFAPLSKFMVGTFGPTRANHAIALTITVVFLLVGIWHGVGWNYAIYGAIHALGVVANHYYTIGLKKWLGREGFKAYNENRWIRAAAVVMTFMYCAASLLFFANTLPQIREIFSILR